MSSEQFGSCHFQASKRLLTIACAHARQALQTPSREHQGQVGNQTQAMPEAQDAAWCILLCDGQNWDLFRAHIMRHDGKVKAGSEQHKVVFIPPSCMR